jgi:hypothetical protein
MDTQQWLLAENREVFKMEKRHENFVWGDEPSIDFNDGIFGLSLDGCWSPAACFLLLSWLF